MSDKLCHYIFQFIFPYGGKTWRLTAVGHYFQNVLFGNVVKAAKFCTRDFQNELVLSIKYTKTYLQ